jgi:hypothetical protein
MTVFDQSLNLLRGQNYFATWLPHLAKGNSGRLRGKVCVVWTRRDVSKGFKLRVTNPQTGAVLKQQDMDYSIGL